MKQGITVTKSNNMIHFHLVTENGVGYLFSQKYTKGVYDYFRYGVTDRELYSFGRWGENPKLDHTIDKCKNKSYRRCALEEMIA